MSNFYHTTFSPSTDAILDEPVAQEALAPQKSEEQPVWKTRAAQGKYKLFHYVLLAYLFLYCSRLPELFPKVRASMALTIVLLAGAVATGRGTKIARTKMGKLLIAFTVWTALCVPFSVWVGGSVDQLKTTVQSVLLAAFVIAFVGTVREVRNAMYAIGIAMATVAALSLSTFRTNTNLGERLGFGDTSTLRDPNFMSLYILMGLPFVYMGVTRGKGAFRVLCLLMIPVMLVAVVHSASRMALILFLVGLGIFLYRASQKERVAVLLATVLIAGVTLPVLPSSVTSRFTTFFHSSRGEEASEAAESAQSRWDLLMRSLELTARHPLFGVGPGQFLTGEANLAKEQGRRRGLWHFTHNAYTQVSSESGIVGAVLYIMAIVASYRGLATIRKRGSTLLIREMAKYIQISLWMVIIGGFFLSIGFGGVSFVIMALSVSFQLAAAAQMKSMQPEVPTR
jgi:O-antigen ligase